MAVYFPENQNFVLTPKPVGSHVDDSLGDRRGRQTLAAATEGEEVEVHGRVPQVLQHLVLAPVHHDGQVSEMANANGHVAVMCSRKALYFSKKT